MIRVQGIRSYAAKLRRRSVTAQVETASLLSKQLGIFVVSANHVDLFNTLLNTVNLS